MIVVAKDVDVEVEAEMVEVEADVERRSAVEQL